MGTGRHALVAWLNDQRSVPNAGGKSIPQRFAAVSQRPDRADRVVSSYQAQDKCGLGRLALAMAPSEGYAPDLRCG